MPIAKSLSKVNKGLAKSPGALHVKGRKFKQLNRATLRDKKLSERKAKSMEHKESSMTILYFLKAAVNEDEDLQKIETFDLNQMKSFIEVFISRYDDELDELKANRRAGRAPTARHMQLQQKANEERELYSTGYKIPDLSNKRTVERLRLWNGSTGGKTVMTFIHIHKDLDELPVKDVEMDEQV